MSVNMLSPWNHKTQNSSSSSSSKIPESFVWELADLGQPKEKYEATIIDLEGFFNGDKLAIEKATQLVKVVCEEKDGCFQVINHGVDLKLVNEAYEHLDGFFKLPIDIKLKALKQRNSRWGFVQSTADRFSTRLPWKETFSFPYSVESQNSTVLGYFNSLLGEDFKPMGMVYQKYCEAMHGLSMIIMEIFAINLGIERDYYRDFFKDASSNIRCNYYPPCEEPSLVLGTGPHCDPPCLTILYEDQVGGLELFANHKWQRVEPRPDAFVVFIGDTFMALTNGKYKSCLHRAVVNKNKERKSIAFFLSPSDDKVLMPPTNLSIPRKYPDFTYSQLMDFTENHYRADAYTLESFANWLVASNT